MLIPSAVIFKPSSGIPVGLFEGFEVFGGGVPTTRQWTMSGGSITQSTANVTQGSFSGAFSSGFNGANLMNTVFYNLSAATSILLDIKPTGNATQAIMLSITDGTNTNSVMCAYGSTTAQTLTLTPTTVNKSAAKIAIVSVDDNDDGQSFWVDNLRLT